MSNYPVNSSVRVATVVAALLAVTTHSRSVAAATPEQTITAAEESTGTQQTAYKAKVIRGLPATGLNNIVGLVPYDFGPPFGPFNFAMFATQNKAGPDPIPLSMDTSSPDDLVVTYANPIFLQLAGKTLADVDPTWQNIPLRDVPVNVDFGSRATDGNGIKRPLRGVLSESMEQVAQAEPADPITLGRWLQGRGTLKIICHSGELATIKMSVRNLLPNRVYGMGATLGGLHNTPTEEQQLAPYPLGGAPHLMTTDENGDGEIERQVNFCPLEPDSAERTVLLINLLYYARHQNYGAVAEPVFVNGLWLGMVTFNALQFPVNVTMNPDFHGVPNEFWERAQ